MDPSLPTLPDSPMSSCSERRRQLRALRVKSRPDLHPTKWIFPEDRIRRLFTEDYVKTLLECRCRICSYHKQIQDIADPATYTSHILGLRSVGPHSTSVVLLALLLFIECPAMIFGFLRARCGDQRFRTQVANFTSSFVRKNYWDKFPVSEVEEYAEKFHWARFQFAIPSIEGSQHEEYHPLAILPFVNERRLGNGHFGEVYAFDIIPGYCNFPELPGMHTFARKELRRNTPESEFLYERHNLILVKQLQDDHLIKIVKTYKHGDVYNFVFPCARTNLNSILRDQNLYPTLHSVGPLYLHPLWDQMLGVARGLHKVLDYEVPDTKPENSMYGYHLDLKPDNILVFEANNLVITDFGQANFKKADGTTSGVNGMGGNEMYAPPEIDYDDIVNTRKYDIWSLGCILLEVCTFVANGVCGVKSLDKIRSEADTETRNCTDCFFRAVPTSVLDLLVVRQQRPGTYELKPRIREWIKRLPEFAHDDSSKDFLQEILSIVLKMLEPDFRSRISSKEVCIQLSEIISHYQSRELGKQQFSYTIPERPSGGSDIGVELLDKIQPISYNLEGSWMCAPLYFVQRSALLCVQIFEGKKWTMRPLGTWSLTKLIPKYALENRGKQSNAEATVLLSLNDPSGHPVRKYGKFSTSRVLLLQELLLAQRVHKQIQLETVVVNLKEEKRVPKFMSRKKGNNRDASSEVNKLIEAQCLQFWTESPRADMIRLSSEERRKSPRSLRLRPDTVRLVVFYQKSILILRLTQDMQMEKQDNADPASTSIDIVPRGKSSFPVSILRPGSEDVFAGFSVSQDDFEANEMEYRKDCKKLRLNFQNQNDADSFQRAYKRLKKHWLNEFEKFSKLQGNIGAEIGYC